MIAGFPLARLWWRCPLRPSGRGQGSGFLGQGCRNQLAVWGLLPAPCLGGSLSSTHPCVMPGKFYLPKGSPGKGPEGACSPTLVLVIVTSLGSPCTSGPQSISWRMPRLLLFHFCVGSHRARRPSALLCARLLILTTRFKLSASACPCTSFGRLFQGFTGRVKGSWSLHGSHSQCGLLAYSFNKLVAS